MEQKLHPQRILTTKAMVKVSVLSAIAFVLMFFQIPLPFAPPFLQIDISDVPALIGAFAMGPVPGMLIVLLKNILNLMVDGTKTQFVGELSNFIVGSVFVMSASVIYLRNKTLKTAVIATIVSIFVMSIAATLSNYFIVFPLYATAFGIDLQALTDMASALNPLVSSYETMMVAAVFPFNLVKGMLTGALTMLLYKRISPILHR